MISPFIIILSSFLFLLPPSISNTLHTDRFDTYLIHSRFVTVTRFAAATICIFFCFSHSFLSRPHLIMHAYALSDLRPVTCLLHCPPCRRRCSCHDHEHNMTCGFELIEYFNSL